MRISQLRPNLEKLIHEKVPVMLVGAPGIGKTSVPTQIFRDLSDEWAFVVSHPTTDDPVDYRGIPMVMRGRDGNEEARFVPVGTLAELQALDHSGKRVLWLIDDLGQAPLAVQAALMQPIGARALNGIRLGENVSIVATTNRREDKAAVHGIIAPLRDRCVVIHLETDLKDWRSWAAKNEIHPSVVGYLSHAPHMLSKPNPTLDADASPSPRGWERVSKILDIFSVNHESLVELVAGCIGDGAAHEFNAFLKVGDKLPTPKEIERSPTGSFLPKESMGMYSIVCSLAFCATKKNMGKYVKYVSRMPTEYGIVFVTIATERDPTLMVSTPEIEKWIQKNEEVFHSIS